MVNVKEEVNMNTDLWTILYIPLRKEELKNKLTQYVERYLINWDFSKRV